MSDGRRRSGSWPWIAAGCVVFVAGFVALRAQSPVLAAEREADAVRDLARRLGLRPASALALRAGALGIDRDAFESMALRFRQLANELGEELAAVAVFGDEAIARAWASEPGGPAVAFDRHRGEPAALPGVAFAQRRGLFAMRPSGQDE